jgi:DNA primase
MINLDWFDIERYLSHMGIPFDTSGKNIQTGWLAISCPWCGDPSNHLGINPHTMGINCWRCPAKGTIISLIMQLERIPLSAVESRIEKFSTREISTLQRSLPDSRMTEDIQQIKLPSQSQLSFSDFHAEYLVKRGFDTHTLTSKYGLQFTGPLGNYRMRMVVPIYMDHKAISFTTRDVTGKAHIPWLHGKPEHVVISPKECLYNIDTVRDIALVVEGVTDVWRLGDGAVATFGDKYTKRQVYMLRGARRVIVMYDAEEEAQANASKLAYDLSPFVSDVHQFELDHGDPGDLSESDVQSIRAEIFGRKH